jgi:hypothetical protein
VATTKVLFVKTNHGERLRWTRGIPALQGVELCAPHAMPINTELRGNMGGWHRLRLQCHVLLEAHGFTLVALRPGEQLDGCAFAEVAA